MSQVHYRIFLPGTDSENVYVLKCDGEVVLCSDQNRPQDLLNPEVIVDITVDGHLCSMYFNVLKDEQTRKVLLNYLKMAHGKRSYLINVNVVEPRKHLLDRKGNEMSELLALERRELDHALAWFSTLGGAFSALGDTMSNCAIMAGKISTQQFKLALRLGDPNLLSRCRLYMALSLIQQKDFKTAKTIIRNEYHSAKEQLVRDNKLISMCFGIWAKLKYDKSIAKRPKCLTQGLES